jgi:hypothetical protein
LKEERKDTESSRSSPVKTFDCSDDNRVTIKPEQVKSTPVKASPEKIKQRESAEKAAQKEKQRVLDIIEEEKRAIEQEKRRREDERR